MRRQSILKLTPESKIYVLCPSQVATGGPEAIHQLVHELRVLGYDASIVYSPQVDEPTPAAYRHYGINNVWEIDDKPLNLLIVPEVWADRVKEFSNMQKAIWWLSVD
ncbi:MAG: hypothetical protein NC930_07645, partial [Candidatus Omnitrophica bacterium]|nr:hypothetical protein [Candidatus Omnitrophota bacterium]